MSMARLSVLGMMRYDDTIFDEIVLPHAPWSKYFTENNITITEPDKDILVAHILRKTANLEIFYPTMQTLKSALRVWSITNYYKWLKLWESLHYDYNPIWNKDANYTEEEHFTRDLKDEYGEEVDSDTDGTYSDTENGTKNTASESSGTKGVTSSGTKDDTTSSNGTKNTTTSGTKNSTSTDSISSFNVNGLQDREKNVYTETTSGTETVTTQESGSIHETTSGSENTQTAEEGSVDETTTNTQTGTYHEDFTAGKQSTNDATGTTDTLRTRREYGNIGVTTTQQMLEAERELAAFNWYDMVCDSFIAEFCIQVY